MSFLLMQSALGDFICDAVFKTEHTHTVNTTDHPVQSGATISDHAVNAPDEVKMEIGFSDATPDSGENHSVLGYQTILTLMRQRMPVTLVTRVRTYRNMVIVAMSVPDDYTTMNAVKISVGLKEIVVAETSMVSVQGLTSGNKSSSNSSYVASTKKQDAGTNQPNVSAAQEIVNNNKELEKAVKDGLGVVKTLFSGIIPKAAVPVSEKSSTGKKLNTLTSGKKLSMAME